MMSGVIYVDSRMPSFIHSLDGPVKCLNRYWWPVKCQELQRCWGWSKVPITRVFSDLFPASPLLCLVTGITSIGYMLPWGQPWQLAHSWLQPMGALGKLETRGQEKLGELASLLTAFSPSPLPLLCLLSLSSPSPLPLLSLSSPSGGASSNDGISSKPPSPSLVPPGPGSLLFLTSGFPWGGLVDHSTLSKPRYLVPHIQFPLSIHPVFLIGFWLLQALKMTN